MPRGQTTMPLWLTMQLAVLYGWLLAAAMSATTSRRWMQAPGGPSQACQDDAGPPWHDDGETYPFKRYHDDTPAMPVLQDNECPSPLKSACEAKPSKAAYLEGPVDCGGQGWFCRIIETPAYYNNCTCEPRLRCIVVRQNLC